MPSPFDALSAPELPLSALDRALGALLARGESPERGPAVAAAAAWTSRATDAGHACLRLDTPPRFEAARAIADLWPTAKVWHQALEGASGLGHEPEFRPLVLDGDRLYLHRYWTLETRLLEQLRSRAGKPLTLPAPTRFEQSLAALFADEAPLAGTQHAAARRTGGSRLALICGGPGTGKTTTVLRLLLAWLDQPWIQAPRIALAAPTGKAAQRLQQSLQQGLAQVGQTAPESLPQTASTIHRLLGAKSDSPEFRHHAGAPLPHDLVIVDEASMVDLPLMARLLEALHPEASLWLLGDPDQLASVEVGSVLADLVHLAQPGHPLEACLSRLERVRRFGEASGIGAFCARVRQGAVTEAVALLRSGERPDLSLASLPSPRELAAQVLASPAGQALRQALTLPDPQDCLRALAAGRILCALRRGPYGVGGLNQALQALIARDPAISAGRQPIIVGRNAPELGLYNGDCGLIDDGWAHFQTPEGPRRLTPHALPEHEPAYALTIHRSQGSEYGQVTIVLPDQDTPLLTRELLYTAVSRAREGVQLLAPAALISATLHRRIERVGGLLERWALRP